MTREQKRKMVEFTEEDVKALRDAINSFEPHDHEGMEGMNECLVCDEPLLRTATNIIQALVDKCSCLPDGRHRCPKHGLLKRRL